MSISSSVKWGVVQLNDVDIGKAVRMVSRIYQALLVLLEHYSLGSRGSMKKALDLDSDRSAHKASIFHLTSLSLRCLIFKTGGVLTLSSQDGLYIR